MASETIKAKDLTVGTAVKFYDGQWHRTTAITKLKRKDATEFPRGTFKTLYVSDSRGYGNHFAPNQDVEIDRSL
jgi:hypothetical protein